MITLKKFFSLARQQPQIIRYEGPVDDRRELASIYNTARGFVLLSTMETRSLAAEEAAAASCPLLLGDLPWARATFGTNATYAPITSSFARTAQALKSFYQAAPSLSLPAKPSTWKEVALQLGKIYKNL